MELLHLILPVLFPSWRFFGEIGASPRVEFRDASGHWRDAMARPQRLSAVARLGRLVWNPDWNEALFLTALAERLLTEPEPWIEPEISARLSARFAVERPAFRIALVTPGRREVVFSSDAG